MKETNFSSRDGYIPYLDFSVHQSLYLTMFRIKPELEDKIDDLLLLKCKRVGSQLTQLQKIGFMKG